MIKWEDRYITGDESVDRQHKVLFEMLNDFEASIKEGRGKNYLENSFILLEAYAVAHFGFEEFSMEKNKCMATVENKGHHQSFIKKVKDFKMQYQSGIEQDELVVRIHRFIEEWITSHILDVDIHLRTCIQKKSVD